MHCFSFPNLESEQPWYSSSFLSMFPHAFSHYVFQLCFPSAFSRYRRMMKEERRRQMERMAEQQRPASADEVSTLHPPVDCLITAWSPWSACSATCGKGFRRKFRMVKRHPTPGGKKCPKKLEKKQKCKLFSAGACGPGFEFQAKHLRF